MARLLKDPHPWPWHDRLRTVDSWREESRALKEMWDAGQLVACAVADGAAYYVVVKRRPLTLRWLPFGDAWCAPVAWLRGLRTEDL
jgi:hypothetical protein